MSPMAEAQRISITDHAPDISLVVFSDRKILDEMCIHEIQEQLNQIVATKAGNMVLSFKNVEHLSSAALGMLITLKKRDEHTQGGALGMLITLKKRVEEK